ncbi:glycosyltransferase family 2 protein [Chitinophaga agrisoli]|uniref:Glycosyltransferase family 2 protein n=1 Tax=Chitinophaga agrisoli TaxID=2607653 RepID=A0A5B2W558_9BACT|nr:glycosyltransferase family 2 protein [Chitinophaga agrisoli]KAA2245359.1 glycosyltransferase family 2 protein [Chitinophaga agrisoli]
MFDITCSIVLYKNDRKLLTQAIESFLRTTLNVRLYLVDNSPDDSLRDISSDPRVEYIFNNANPGFGAGHNVAFRRVLDISPFHLVLNPDIVYEQDVLQPILAHMQSHPRAGVLMPQILNEDGSIQYLAKLLPTPFDFFIRRFIPVRWVLERLNERFELRKSGYNKIINAPFLSGCFLVFNTRVLQEIGLFDEKIFMYTEDIDITRRVSEKYDAVFFPQVAVYHLHERKSFRDIRNFKVYLKSTLYYFNKWGWFFDRERRTINRRTLAQF